MNFKIYRLPFSFCLGVWLLLAASMPCVGQGTIAANKINGGGNPTSTNFGVFFDADGGLYYETPINVTILGGPDANNLTLIVTLAGPNALVPVYSGGRYMDPSGGSYTIPGVASGQPATLQVLAWKGNAATFGDSNLGEDRFWSFAGSVYVEPTLFTFTNPTGGFVPSSLDGMPAMWRFLDVPEPPAIALIVLGIAMAVLFRGGRRKA